jgi:hypothetical protein
VCFSLNFLVQNGSKKEKVGKEKAWQDDRRAKACLYGTEASRGGRNEEKKGRHVNSVSQGTKTRLKKSLCLNIPL